MKSLTLFAPAKVNLFLAITGRRTDGYHDLVSVTAPVTFGDELTLQTKSEGAYSLECDAADVPTDESNLVLKAARLFAAATNWTTPVHFRLAKRVPAGAGLGGGSSDGTTTLLGLNQLAGNPLNTAELTKLAAQLGSDCVLFLAGGPCVMRGRGERVELLPETAATRIHSRRLLLFKPSFGINTAWAYREMAALAPAAYLPGSDAESRLATWINSAAGLEELVFNNMERVAFAKYVALPTLLAKLRKKFGLTVGMSGSGSACYALLVESSPVAEIRACIQDALGAQVFVAETQIR